MHVCLCVYVSMSVLAVVRMCLHGCIGMRVSVFLYLFVILFVCVCICLCVHTYVCVCVVLHCMFLSCLCAPVFVVYFGHH